MLSKYLDPKNDVAFRKIFGTEKNKDILMHFLNDILGFSGSKQITSVTFLSTIQDPDIAAKKQSIVDVLCQDDEGVRYIIEMQVAKTKGFEKRAQYYAAKAYSQQANRGDEYQNLKEIIFIAIADCTLFPEKTQYKSDHIILDRDSGEHDLKDFSFTFIELPKFKKSNPKDLESITEKWCYFFKYAAETGPECLKHVIGKDTIIEDAYEQLDRFYWTESELMNYERELKRVRDEAAILAQKIDDATEKGIQQGIQQGMQQGIQQGMQQGIQQGSKETKFEIARQLLGDGLDRAVIKRCTGLSDEELDSLA
ncbi:MULTISPECIES: Rpn family recombination-promoting nuclease/putative transposase [Candidatus Regiella]|uniref:Transposase n=1 Tax=Candidatus Regiella insecticola TaxID=138073 RepID=A0A6L2ZNL9_9ENTR|nr:Rpn family recombination-promoting nuclease/putative transposase [Candidatus Regiella insecticola]GFN46393.1 transposase [Candidatus Regiella insecticola]